MRLIVFKLRPDNADYIKTAEMSKYTDYQVGKSIKRKMIKEVGCT